MKKILGILGLLIAVCIITMLLSDRFFTPFNVENLLRRTSLFAILGIGVAFVIITGGIDLSIGSVIALVGVLLPFLLTKVGWSLPAALGAVVALSITIGLIHGLLITKLRLQPFIVTLCGLLIYRGVARTVTGDQTQGFGNDFDTLKMIATEEIPITESFGLPAPLLIMLAIAAVAGVFLNQTIYGRYMLALGHNEQAARYSGINTDLWVIWAYVICSLLAGLGGMLFVMDVNSAQPADFGNFYELYAIAAAVLGGCSLRGGEGSIVGVIIGTAVLMVLRNAIMMIGIPTQMEFAIIGVVILLGVIADEMVKRYAARRRAARSAAASARLEPVST